MKDVTALAKLVPDRFADTIISMLRYIRILNARKGMKIKH
jgi:hypothetical protein